jgi:tetratricopeptide (TPR) repeat protein
MRRTCMLLVSCFVLACLLPASLFAKEEKRKDKGAKLQWLIIDVNTKQVVFVAGVQSKVDAVLSGALKAVTEANRADAESYNITDSYLTSYDIQLPKYDYDYSKEFKGDENDPDFEKQDPSTTAVQKFIADSEKVRDYKWGWYWSADNKSKRLDKKGKWAMPSMLKKLAWKHYRAAVVLHNQGKYEDAKNELLIALWFWPLFAEAHAQMGIENIFLSQFDQAEINFKRATKIDTDYKMAYYGLSIVYLKKTPMDIPDAVESCEYAQNLGYKVDQDYYDFLMTIIGQYKTTQ